MKELKKERIEIHSNFVTFRAVTAPRNGLLFPRNRFLPFLILVLFFSACDNDTKFQIATSETLILMQKDSSAEKQMLSYKAGKSIEIASDFANIQKLSDLDGRNNQYCYGKVADKQLYYEYIKQRANGGSAKGIGHILTDYSPHYVALGENYVVFSDTNKNKLGFIKKNKNDNPIIRDLPQKPLEITYAFGKFYVVYANETVGIWDEKALSERNVVNLKGKFLQSAQNANSLEIFSQRNDSIFQSIIEFETDFLKSSLPTDAVNVQYSPYSRIEYGNEWLQNPTLLKNGKLLPNKDSKEVLADSVTSFAIDFSQSIMYYTKQNQLFIQKIGSTDILASAPFKGKILKTFFKQDYLN